MVSLNTNTKTTEPLTYEQMILSEIRGLKDDIREVKSNMRELRSELKETKRELNERMDKLDGRMDRLETRIDSSIHHSQIMTATVVGIALAVIYFVFTH